MCLVRALETILSLLIHLGKVIRLTFLCFLVLIQILILWIMVHPCIMNLGMNQLYFKCGPTANLIAIFLVACYELNIIFLRFVLLKKKKFVRFLYILMFLAMSSSHDIALYISNQLLIEYSIDRWNFGYPYTSFLSALL